MVRNPADAGGVDCTCRSHVRAPGNGGSLDKCRRRWDLAEDPQLRYKFMYAFDRAMNHLDKVRPGSPGF
jgi:hypothetical protein